jgi:glycosyltransferase involved in cell wall biosynthesis
MRILFLCGCLEPAKDGVGDYVRSLAEACLAQGHECRAIALNDPFVAEPIETAETMAGGRFPVLRLPSAIIWFKRTKHAVAFRDGFQPDWISLQFVGYGLNPKGIVWKIVPDLKTIAGDYPLHVMFHELWVGMPPSAPFKHRIFGAAQRLSIRRLCAVLKPELVTTSNWLYVEALRRIGVASSNLPLFGNIPIADRGHSTEFPGSLGDLKITPTNRDEWWLGVFFGGLYPGWKPEPFLGLLRRAAKRAGKRVCLVSLGRLGAVGEAIWDELQHTYPDISLPVLGEQPAEVVSIVMQSADFGIAASPWDLIGKSGSATAMIEHGLPVIVTREDRQSSFAIPEPSTDPLFHSFSRNLEQELIDGLRKGTARSRRNDIAAKFCTLLESGVVGQIC